MRQRSKTAARRRSANRKQRQRRQRLERRRAGSRRAAKRVFTLPRRSAPLYRRSLQRLVENAYEHLLHAKQLLSLFMIAYGIVHSDRLGVAAVGTAMARAFGKKPKHGIKQVDRCLSNKKLDMQTLFDGFVPIVVGQRGWILVTLDWTEFDKDDQTTVSVNLVSSKNRAVPLVWLSVYKSELKGRQRRYERTVLRMFANALPPNTEVVVLADRGFGDVKLYNYIHKTLGFDFVIRYRASIYVSHEEWLYPSSELVPRNGRIRVLRDTELTAQEAGPFTVVLYKAMGMKDSWCLATSLNETTGREIVDLYSCRFQCEEAFRDLKDRRYGYGLRFTKITDCKRRDRFLLLFALAYLVQTLLGHASETLGLDKELRANTATERTHSLFRQGRALLGELAAETYAAIAQEFRLIQKTLYSHGLPGVFI
jgi:hypothetical protein